MTAELEIDAYEVAVMRRFLSLVRARLPEDAFRRLAPILLDFGIDAGTAAGEVLVHWGKFGGQDTAEWLRMEEQFAAALIEEAKRPDA